MNKYKLNNWIPGSDIEIDQLIKTENYFTQKLIDSLATKMTDTNYGLLALHSNRIESCKLELEVLDDGSVRLNLLHCMAVTRTGCRIHYNSAFNQPVYIMLDSGSQDAEEEQIPSHWNIVLTVDPFQRIPLAQSVNDKKLPTDYFADSFYSLSVMSDDTFNKSQQDDYTLIIGRIVKKAEEYLLDSQYIPPCQKMESHSELIRYNYLFEKQLNELERVSFVIIDKIHSTRNHTFIENSIFTLCKAIVMYIAKIYSLYRNTSSHLTPIENITYFSSLAFVIKTDLAKLNPTDKEELLKYFHEWNDINPGAFEETLKDISQLKYNHKNIRSVMVQTEQFLILITELWYTLSKLHFIGQHKENIVISERTKEYDIPRPSGGWVILD